MGDGDVCGDGGFVRAARVRLRRSRGRQAHKTRTELDKAAKLKIPWPRYRLIAVPEAAAAAGLLAGLLP
jgi:hypothetical protein